jgi:hypothetical protein
MCSSGLFITITPRNAINIWMMSSLLMFSFKNILANKSEKIGKMKNTQLAVETGIYFTEVSFP